MRRGKGITRRDLLKRAAAGTVVAAAAAMGGARGLDILVPQRWDTRRAFAQPAVPLDPRTLTKYLDPLPIPGVMPQTSPNYYEVGIHQVSQQLHSQLPLTTVWGYGTSQATASYPAATFEAVRGMPIQVKWTNNLSGITHPLPVDQTLHWADPLMQHPTFAPYTGPIPVVTHLHGGEVEPQSDGNPDSWFTPGFAIKGPGWKQEVYNYPNQQPAATLWYHDHALGITRLNVFMGLAGFYIIRDPAFETPLNLPSGPYEIPIVIQDRMLDISGQLLYPAAGINPTVHPFWMPEFFGDTILVNGKAWPYLSVEPRKYRFRFLNGSDARFYSLSLSTKQPFLQIGTDGGYLSAPVPVTKLLIAPGERADVIVDFTGLAVGTQILLTNDAKAPFPNGAPADPKTVGQIIQFRVVPLTAPDTSAIPTTLNTITPLGPASVTRTLTLNEVMGPGGPLAMFLDGKEWFAPITETPAAGSTEIWEIINLTADTHPIHLHLTQFQLLSRQRFQTNKYLKAYTAANPIIPVPAGITYNPVPVTPYLQGSPVGPNPNEAGWKDTVRMNPGEVTRIIVRFAPIGTAAVTPYPFDATAEPGYVWHCHILEHEDNEMMRPYKVV
jgi:spore coat protein A, manganese oxidase